MHKTIEGLNGVHVIADDFLFIGSGSTTEEAIKDHDANLSAFLQPSRKKGLKLIRTKRNFDYQKSNTFVGYRLTSSVPAPDPKKVESIVKMPQSTNVHDVRRFLGMINYLSKFLDQLSSRCEIIRQPDRKGVERRTSLASQSLLPDLPYKHGRGEGPGTTRLRHGPQAGVGQGVAHCVWITIT